MKNRSPFPYLYLVYLKNDTWMITDNVSITKTPPIINNRSSFLSRMDIVPKAAPNESDPVSPIKISAGEALNHRNPKQAPTTALEKMLNSPALGRYNILRYSEKSIRPDI